MSQKTESIFASYLQKPSRFLQVIYKNRVDFYACYKKPSRFLQSTHQKRHNFEANGTAHQANVLIFAKNRPIKIDIMILKQTAHQANVLVFAENRPIKIGTILKQMAHHR